MTRSQSLVAASLVLLLSACGQSKIDKAEESFVDGCHLQGAENSVCSCIFDKLKDRYGAEQLVSFDRVGPVGLPSDFGKTVVEGAAQCRN